MAVFAISLLEIAIAILWFNARTQGIAKILLLTFFFTTLGALGYQLRFSNPPDCACFGLLQQYSSVQTDARGALHRGMWLLGMYGTGWLGAALCRPSLIRGAP